VQIVHSSCFLFTGALAGSLFLKRAKKSIPPLWYTFLLALVLFLVPSSCSVSSDAIKESISKNLLKRGRIGIRSRVENDALVIWVTDNGNGIPQNIQKRIFDPFFTTKEPGKGTGQGLAIAHDIIVVKHKGSLDFTSQEGQGTTFIISLPLNSNPQ
jgi:nitrogen-specific signal transduction histidine kinase